MSPVVLKVRAAVEREKSRTAVLQQQARLSARHCSDAERDLAQTKQVVAALRKPTAIRPDASLPVASAARCVNLDILGSSMLLVASHSECRYGQVPAPAARASTLRALPQPARRTRRQRPRSDRCTGGCSSTRASQVIGAHSLASLAAERGSDTHVRSADAGVRVGAEADGAVRGRDGRADGWVVALRLRPAPRQEGGGFRLGDRPGRHARQL